MSDNWIVSNLENALADWNGKLGEIWALLTQSPETFKGGTIWSLILNVHNALVGIGYGLLVLFFAMAIFQSAASFRDFQRPEYVLRHLIRFILAKTAVGRCMEIMTAIFNICGGITQTVMSGLGGSITTAASLPGEIVTAIEGVGLLESIPLWLVSLLGTLFITVMSFILLLTVYGRFFRLYMFTALAPLPLASFAGQTTSSSGRAFIKSYIGVCMEGAVIVLACLIYSAFLSSSAPAVDSSLPAVTMAWQYIGQLIFNMLMELELFQMDIGELIRDYKAQGLPVPPMEQLRAEAAAEARKCLETMMVCEAKGHLWKETADPENGTSTLSCRRCGVEEHLRW